MDAGRLRHPVTLERPEHTQDPVTGAMRQQWAEVGSEWASIEGISGREFLSAGATQAETTYRITLRHRPIEPTWRLISGGVAYGIEAILPSNDRTRLVLMCKTI